MIALDAAPMTTRYCECPWDRRGRAWKPGNHKADRPRKRLFHVGTHGDACSMAGRVGQPRGWPVPCVRYSYPRTVPPPP